MSIPATKIGITTTSWGSDSHAARSMPAETANRALATLAPASTSPAVSAPPSRSPPTASAARAGTSARAGSRVKVHAAKTSIATAPETIAVASPPPSPGSEPASAK